MIFPSSELEEAGRTREENEDLIVRIIRGIRIRALVGGRTKFFWVKGHAGDGDVGNKAADKLATRGLKSEQIPYSMFCSS
jgi:ribonuclease HI